MHEHGRPALTTVMDDFPTQALAPSSPFFACVFENKRGPRDSATITCRQQRACTTTPLSSPPRHLLELARRPSQDMPSLESKMQEGVGCTAAYEVRGSLSDLDKAVAAFGEALKMSVEVFAQYAEPQSQIRTRLAYVHYLRGVYLRSIADYNGAIELQERALASVNADMQPQVFADRAGDLALYLSARFDRTNDMDDITKAVKLGLRALECSRTGDPHIPKCMAVYANALVRLAINTKDLLEGAVVENLEEAGRLFEKALLLFRPDDAWKAQACFLYAYCLVLHTRRLSIEGTEFYDRAVQLASQAVVLSQNRVPLRIVALGWLGFITYCRHLQTATAAHLDESIAASEQLRDILSDKLDHSFWTFNLPNLANYYVDRFEYTGDTTDVDSAIQLLESVLRLLAPDEPTKPARLFALGRAYTARFACTAKVQDLDEAVQTYREAVRLSVPSQRGTYLQYLGCALVERSIHQQNLQDLDKAIDRLREAIDVSERSMQGGLSADLANALTMRYKASLQDGAIREQDLSHALELYDRAVRDRTLLKHHDLHLSQYGCALQEKWQRYRQVGDLSTALQYHHRALEMAQTVNGRLDLFQVRLASALRDMYSVTKGTNPVLLQEAFQHLEAALNVVGDTHPLFSMHLNELGRTYVARWKMSNQQGDMKLALDAFRTAALVESSVPKDRLEAAMAWVELSQGNAMEALRAYQVAIDLLPRVAWLGLEQDVRYRTLHWVSLGTDAAACAIEAGQLELAVELLEQGRSVLWNSSLQLRQEQHELERLNPYLADELTDVGRVLELNISRKTGQSGSSPTLGPMKGPTNEEKEELEQQNHRKLVQKWETLVEEVRQYPGFENFLRSAPYATLRRAAVKGPVVIVNISRRRCDALIVTIDRPVQLVPLSSKSSHFDHLANTLHEHLSKATDKQGFEAANSALIYVMDELWKGVASPVCAALQGLFALDGRHRLWLIPTGSLTALPLHAATWRDNVDIGFPSLAVVSYTTSLTALIRARHPGKPSRVPRLLAVSQPIAPGRTRLPDSVSEVKVLFDLLPSEGITSLRAEDATVSTVTVQLERHNFLHLCSHGEHDATNPYHSSFALYDGPLLLSEIMKLRLTEADFAFLSACHTARVDPRAADECVHLASSLHLAGYKSIIATMWGIIDMDGPEVSRHVYEYLTRNGMKSTPMLNHTEAAEALHFAITQARAAGKPALRWVPFVHHGV